MADLISPAVVPPPHPHSVGSKEEHFLPSACPLHEDIATGAACEVFPVFPELGAMGVVHDSIGNRLPQSTEITRELIKKLGVTSVQEPFWGRGKEEEKCESNCAFKKLNMLSAENEQEATSAILLSSPAINMGCRCPIWCERRCKAKPWVEASWDA